MQKPLPKGWKMVRLGEVCELFNGKTPSEKEKRADGFPVLKIKDVDDKGAFVGHFDSFVDHSFFEKYKNKTIKSGDTLLLNAAHNADYVGSKSFFVDNMPDSLIATGEWLIVRANEACVSNKFKHYWIADPTFSKKKVKEFIKGIHLYPKDFSLFQIPLPPLSTQHKIVVILEEADNLRKLRRQVNEKMKDLIPSLFVQMFGDPATNPKGWEMKTIGVIASKEKFSIRMGPFGSQLKKHELVNEGIKVLWIENIVNNKFEWKDNRCITSEKYNQLKGFQVRPGDILTTTMGTIGKSCVVPEDIGEAIISSHLLKITLNSKLVNPVFVAEYIRQPFAEKYFHKSSHGIVMKGLNTTIIKSLPVYLPPLLLQQEFAKLVEDIETEKARQAESKKKLDELFQSLMQRAFTGELVA